MCHWKLHILVLCTFCCCMSLSLGCGGDTKKEIRFVEAAEDFTQISADELDFGRQENTLRVTLSNNNNMIANWSASANVSWITVKPERSSIAPWSEMRILITVDRSKLTASSGDGLVTIDIPTYEEKKHIRVKVQA